MHVHFIVVFVSLSSTFAAITSAVGVYWLIGMGDEVSILMKLIGLLWMNTGIALIVITLNQPGQTQTQIKKTAELLLADDFCQFSSDNQAWRIIRCMVDRACYSSAKMYFLQAFAVDQHFAHKVLLIAPNIGTVMALIKKSGLV
ncbi:hypothetical protein TELCIR_16565 [Teladorsagia circumcincta]|uniref:Uncharacterized protein n=1 Tax=Teladorsagia circumcincta TaxID=45464 RepID=A0A2G9TVE5_TELCI|nr:hypothetical protein TELCIR_16565 [Teladorsagia circumcincta]